MNTETLGNSEIALSILVGIFIAACLYGAYKRITYMRNLSKMKKNDTER